MDKVQKYNSFNTNTPSSESYRNYLSTLISRIDPWTSDKEQKWNPLDHVAQFQCLLEQ